MKIQKLTALLSGFIAISLPTPSAFAANNGSYTYNNTITDIAGQGDTSAGWATFTDGNQSISVRGLQVGNTVNTANDNGVFTYVPDNNSYFTFEASINSDVNGESQANGGLNIAQSGYTYELYVSTPANPGVYGAPINILSQSSVAYGNNSTPEGYGTVAGYGSTASQLAATYNIAQTYEDVFPNQPIQGANPPYGTYNEELVALDPQGQQVMNIPFTVDVVPEPNSLVLALAGGIAFCGIIVLRKNHKPVLASVSN